VKAHERNHLAVGEPEKGMTTPAETVRVVRGRAETPAADRAVTAALLDRTAETGVPAVRVWQPHRQVAFGRRDTRVEAYDAAKESAQTQSFEPTERRVGGRAVAYTGRTLAVAHAIPINDIRQGMCDRYKATSQMLVEVLTGLGADVTRGEPPHTYCPGSHSVSSLDKSGEPAAKVAGIAQRVQSGAALVAGCLTVSKQDVGTLQEVLVPVYQSVGVDFDPATVGSVETAGGSGDPDVVAHALEDALVDGRETTVRTVGAGPRPEQ